MLDVEDVHLDDTLVENEVFQVKDLINEQDYVQFLQKEQEF